MDMESSFFPFHLLPLNLQETILFLLPISTLIVCTNVSRTFRSLIRSQSFISSYKINNSCSNSQPLFLFRSVRPSLLDAYDPLFDRWFPFPDPLITLHIRISAGPLRFSAVAGLFVVSDHFSLTSYQISPLLRNQQDPDDDGHKFYPIALISGENPSVDFKIVAISTAGDRVLSQVYDSRNREWAMKGGFEGMYAVIESAVFLDVNGNGLLYCLARCPDHLLTFDPVGGEWGAVGVGLGLPAGRCSHIMAFDGRLFLAGGMEELGAIVRIGIWELDLRRTEWRVHCLMPDDVFVEFCKGGLNYFQTVDRKGKICFLGSKRAVFYSILMCDLEANRWWWPRDCESRDTRMDYCWVHVVEPYIDLVKANG